MSTYRLIAAALALSLLAAPVTAQDRDPARAGALPKIAFTEFRLENGLRVILHEDRSTPIVAVNLWYHVGSKNEVPGKTGFAHLFEHMMFQGSKRWNDEYFTPIQEAGGTLNGSTNQDRTNYWEVVPSNFLELALFLEADRMGGLLDAMTEEKLANQRDVVKNEKRQNYDNQPYGLVRARIAEEMYPEGHPYRWLTIGSLEDLSAASMDDVKDFFRRFYTPNNASLAIAGDFDPAEARRLVEKYFGPIAKGPARQEVRAPEAKLAAAKRVAMEDRVSLGRIYLVWHSVPQYSPDDAALSMLSSLLTSAKGSRLYKALVYERQVAQSVAAFNGSREIGGEFQIVVTAKPGVSLADLERAVDEELARIRATPPTADEMARAYNAIEAGFVFGLQTVGGFGGKSDQLNAYATYRESPGWFEKDLSRYRAVTAEDVQRVARTYLTDRRLVLTVTPRGQSAGAATAAAATPAPSAGPGQAAGATPAPTKDAAAASPATGAAPTAAQGGATAAAQPAKADPSVLPKAGPDPSLALPRIQRRKLSNGLDVLVVEHHELPVVSMSLVFKNGAEADPEGRAGLATLAADLLDEGTKTRSSLDISNELAAIGARLGTSAGFDATGVSMTTLVRHLDRALGIYADVVTSATFPETELARLRKERLAALVQRRDNANLIAESAYASVLYGASHPYGRPELGTEDSIAAITLEDVRRFAETHYRPGGSALIVVGDVRPDEIVAKLERAFADWKGTAARPAALPSPASRESAGVYLVDRPGSAQSVLAIGQVGVPRATADYFPLLVMNTMLGGQFSSRVNLNLRENKGYTYGARTSFDFRRGAGPFQATAGVQTAVTREAIAEFLRELRGIRGEIPVTARELETTKQTIVRAFPRGFETPQQIAGRLVDLVLYDLPDDYFNTYSARVRAVTADDIARVASKYLDPSRMAIVVVGDRSVIEAGLNEIAGPNGSIVVLDPRGRPVAGTAPSGSSGGSR